MQQAFKDLGVDPKLVLADSVSSSGFSLVLTDVRGKRLWSPDKKTMLSQSSPWRSAADWASVRDAMLADGLGHAKRRGNTEAPALNSYPVDEAILLRRLDATKPTPASGAALQVAEDKLTTAQLDEYETRYAKMYGEDAVHKLGDDVP